MMSGLLALFLLIHGSIHIGFVCSRSWPFAAGDPWPVFGLGMPADVMQIAGTVLAFVAFFAFLLAAGATIGLLPRRVWRWLVVIGAGASAVLLVAFATTWTMPGLVVDGVLLWAALVAAWTPADLRRQAA